MTVKLATLNTGDDMSYQVLARKWRPRTFTNWPGQEHVVRALTNALDQQRLHHAFLFWHPRGQQNHHRPHLRRVAEL